MSPNLSSLRTGSFSSISFFSKHSNQFHLSLFFSRWYQSQLRISTQFLVCSPASTLSSFPFNTSRNLIRFSSSSTSISSSKDTRSDFMSTSTSPPPPSPSSSSSSTLKDEKQPIHPNNDVSFSNSKFPSSSSSSLSHSSSWISGLVTKSKLFFHLLFPPTPKFLKFWKVSRPSLSSSLVDSTLSSTSSRLWSHILTEAAELVELQASKGFPPFASQLQQLISNDHPLLDRIAKYYFHQPGKQLRPLLVLLIAQATNRMMTSNASSLILPSQRRLAEITELIHTASLLHDDVIDEAHQRRHVASVNAVHGNKLAVLAGDFVLARASVALAHLRHFEVIELLSTVLADLVQGEIMQLQSHSFKHATFDMYLDRIYMKTASLMAKSCRAAALLGQVNEEIAQQAYEYGKHLGLAFQLMDDVLDFGSPSSQDTTPTTNTSSSSFSCSNKSGKPIHADLNSGVITAPMLFAIEAYPELRTLTERKFNQPGDIDKALHFIHQSNALNETRKLAQHHCSLAIQAIDTWSPSPSKKTLLDLTHAVLTRTK